MAEPNMHGDHTASCLCCAHLDTDYDEGYSEVTPGIGWYCECLKGHFTNLTDDETHKLHEYGIYCPDFLPREKVRSG